MKLKENTANRISDCLFYVSVDFYVYFISYNIKVAILTFLGEKRTKMKNQTATFSQQKRKYILFLPYCDLNSRSSSFDYRSFYLLMKLRCRTKKTYFSSTEFTGYYCSVNRKCKPSSIGLLKRSNFMNVPLFRTLFENSPSVLSACILCDWALIGCTENTLKYALSVTADQLVETEHLFDVHLLEQKQR